MKGGSAGKQQQYKRRKLPPLKIGTDPCSAMSRVMNAGNGDNRVARPLADQRRCDVSA